MGAGPGLTRDQHHYRDNGSRLPGVPPIDPLTFKYGIAENTKSPTEL